MLYLKPDYYDDFRCIADKCEDTCCSGWQIVIDDESLAKYKNVTGPFKETMDASVDYEEHVFKQSSDKRCAFLREDNLCKLYAELGEDMLCTTCKRYPRHIEEFEGVREFSLSLSCPTAAQMILFREEPLKLISWEDEKEETFETFDFLLYSEMLDSRELMLELLADRSLRLPVRALFVLAISHDLQRRLNNGDIFSCQEHFEKYRAHSFDRAAENRLKKTLFSSKFNYNYVSDMFIGLSGLEVIDAAWEDMLMESEQILFLKGPKHLQSLLMNFYVYMRKKQDIKIDIVLENLLEYFVYTYYMGGVYDSRIFESGRMAVNSVYSIFCLMAARWVKNDFAFDKEDLIEVSYRFSREIEHSDLNLEMLL